MLTFFQYCSIPLTGYTGDEDATTITTLTGDSGDEYVFEVHALGADLDAVGAVYAVTRKEGNEHVVLYVGHTGDLSDRFNNHQKSECFDDNEADCLCVHRDGNKKSRLKKESDLMSRYRPTCNGPKW
jgi:predicted GIY-YIG superfamily endonuclease